MPYRQLVYAATALLETIVIVYLSIVAYIVAQPIAHAWAQAFYRKSYIAEINTPKMQNWLTEEMLKEFNEMGDGKIISFTPIEKGRKIFIYEREPEKDEVLVGEAEPRNSTCIIRVNNNLDFGTFRETLYHEYLHCMGYLHNEINRKDIMYPSVVPGNKEENIYWYAQDLKKRFYEN